MKNVVSIVLNNFKNDSRVLKENISLQKARYTVKVVALWEDGLEEFETVQNIPVHRVKLKSKNWSKNKIIQLVKYFEFIYRVTRLYKNSDIVHCNDLNTLPAGVLIKKFFNKNVKIVYDAHEYETETHQVQNPIKKFFIKNIEKKLIKYSDKIITVSPSIAKEYMRLYDIVEPTVILNVPFYRDTIEKRDIFRERFEISKDRKIFLYQGSLGKGRGIESIVNTFRESKLNIAIVFMGYGVLKDDIKRASLNSDKIFLHEAVSPSEIISYTSSADFGISTIENICLSYYYSLPNKMFEYLMSEIPIVVSNFPEMRNVVKKYNVGVILKDDMEQTIEDVMSLETSIENFKNVKEDFNWEIESKKLMELYSEL